MPASPKTTIPKGSCKDLVPIMQAYGTCYINTVLNSIMFSPYLSQLAVAHLAQYVRQLSNQDLKAKMESSMFKVVSYEAESCYRMPQKEDDLQSVLYKLIVCKGTLKDRPTHVSLVGRVGYALQGSDPNNGGNTFEIMNAMLTVMKVPFIMMTTDDILLLSQSEYQTELTQVMRKYDVIMRYYQKFEAGIFCNDFIQVLLLEILGGLPRSDIFKHMSIDNPKDDMAQVLAYMDTLPTATKQTIVSAYATHVLSKYPIPRQETILQYVRGNELRFIDDGKYAHLYDDMLAFILSRIATTSVRKAKNAMIANMYDTHKKELKDTILTSYELDTAVITLPIYQQSMAHTIAAVHCDGEPTLIDANLKGLKLPYQWYKLVDTTDNGKKTKAIFNKLYNNDNNVDFRFVCALYSNKFATQKLTETIKTILQNYKSTLKLQQDPEPCQIPYYEDQVRQDLNPSFA